jgi:hypothetical protein
MGSASTPKVLFGWLIQSGLEFSGFSPEAKPPPNTDSMG